MVNLSNMYISSLPFCHNRHIGPCRLLTESGVKSSAFKGHTANTHLIKIFTGASGQHNIHAVITYGRMSICVHYEMWDEITFPFQTSNMKLLIIGNWWVISLMLVKGLLELQDYIRAVDFRDNIYGNSFGLNKLSHFLNRWGPCSSMHAYVWDNILTWWL